MPKLSPGYELRDVTGVYSRAALNIMLQGTIEQAQQEHRTFALLLLDLDHFKSVNDAYGHAFGDRVLADFAHRLERLSRASDTIFRYGGDEFVILLNGASRQQAVSIASRMLSQLNEIPFDTTPPLFLSISVGVVCYPSEGQTAEELFEIADRRHYVAKRSGRGRVVSEDPATGLPATGPLVETPARVIDRDLPLDTVNRFLDEIPEARRGLLTIFGVPGSGKSRFLYEARKIARLKGFAVLPIRGTQAVKSRMYGALDIARQEIENLPAPSTGLPAFTRAIRQSLIDKGNAGLLITVHNLARIDRFTLEYLSTIFTQELQPICILYASEDMSKSTDALRQKLMRDAVLNESVSMTPVSAAGLRIWLRESLHWEAPRAFVEWFHAETGGLPAKITRGIRYILEHSVMRQTPSGREYQMDIEHLHLEKFFNAEESFPLINFPSGLTAFIGREEEIFKAKQLLEDHRLVTVLGPGGSGKSRLALQVAMELWERFIDGVFFVPLSSLSEPAYLITTLASFLQVPLTGVQNPQEAVINLLKQKQLLLVLDNFENLLQGAQLLAEILDKTSGVRILVTSRERLDLPDEMVLEIGGLKYPEPDCFDPIESYSAVQLFVLSGQRSRSDFSLTPENQAHVARICHMVSGMPLGVELAAAWVQTFEPEEIARKIEENLGFLTTEIQGIPDTQQSILAVLASFWDSLSITEQEIVCRLSVFKTRFSEVAARKVSGASSFFLEALVARAFLRKSPRGRFEMHGLLRQYASNLLARNPQEHYKAQSLHSAYFMKYLQEHSDSIRQVKYVLDEVDQEIDNIRAAWMWAVENKQVDALAQTLRTLETYYYLKGYMAEGRAVMQATVEKSRRFSRASESQSSFYVSLLAVLGRYHNWFNDYELTSQVVEEAYPIAQGLKNDKLLAEILMVWGQRLYMTSDFTAGRLKMEKALEHAQLAGDLQLEADILRNLGNIALDMEIGDLHVAAGYYRQSLEICRRIGDPLGEGGALNNLGLISLYTDRFQEAIQYFEENLQVSRQRGDLITESYSLSNMGIARAYTHEYLQGLQNIQESMKIAHLTGSRQDEGVVYWSQGFLYMCVGNFTESQQSFNRALSLLHDVSDRAAESRALGDFSQLQLFQGHLNTCKKCCEQAMEISQAVGLVDTQAYTLVTYGQALFRLGEIDAAEAAFNRAIEVQLEIGKAFMNVEPLAGLARIDLQRHHNSAALEKANKILEQFTAARVAGDFEDVFNGLLDGFDVILSVVQVLRDVKDERSRPLLAEGYNLLQQFASLAGDEVMRQTYLENIPSHKQLSAEYLTAFTPTKG